MPTTTEATPSTNPDWFPTVAPRDHREADTAFKEAYRTRAEVHGSNRLPSAEDVALSAWLNKAHTAIVELRDGHGLLGHQVTKRIEVPEATRHELNEGHLVCQGACGQDLPLKKVPTKKSGGREAVCRVDRDAALAARKVAE